MPPGLTRRHSLIVLLVVFDKSFYIPGIHQHLFPHLEIGQATLPDLTSPEPFCCTNQGHQFLDWVQPFFRHSMGTSGWRHASISRLEGGRGYAIPRPTHSIFCKCSWNKIRRSYFHRLLSFFVARWTDPFGLAHSERLIKNFFEKKGRHGASWCDILCRRNKISKKSVKIFKQDGKDL